MNDFVIFERSIPTEEAEHLRREAEYYRLPSREQDGAFAVLDMRSLRQALPAGSKPVGMFFSDGRCLYDGGEEFYEHEVLEFARRLGWWK